jgi:hypothetical protein
MYRNFASCFRRLRRWKTSTAFGRQVHEGKEDHVRANGINRWLGGVHLCEGAPVWRWDEAARTIRP